MLFAVDQHVGRLSLNRPDRLNTMDLSLVESMLTHVKEAVRQVEAGYLRVLVVSSEGGRAFCAGADLEARRAMDDDQRARHLDLIAELCREVYRFPVPVIAEIHGHCVGGGLELALSCDMQIATESSSFSLPEVKLGMLARSGGTVFARRQVPYGALAELLFTGERVRAPRALEIGLVQRLVTKREDLRDAVATLANGIAAAAPLAVRSTKELLLSSCALPAVESLRLGDRLHRELQSTDDLREGLAALDERRPPVFRGR